MTDTTLRTITLDSASLDAAIDVLSSAAASFCLTPRERRGYRALMISVDLAIVSLVAVVVILVVTMAKLGASGPTVLGKLNWFNALLVLAAIALVGSSAAGAVAFLVNVPLIRRTLQERARLKTIGMTALSKSLWKASRRHNWLGRIRSALIIFFGVIVAFYAIVYLAMSSEFTEAPYLAVYLAVFAVILFGARLLRNQREQMELAASAVELKKALQSLRQQAGATRTIAVPAELVERAATIESAGIARQRKEAILQGASSQSSGYAITFDDKATVQRTGLDMKDRLELDDLLARLSSASQPAGTQAQDGAFSRCTTESKRVEVEYTIDQASRGIHITAVKRTADEAVRAMGGASDG